MNWSDTQSEYEYCPTETQGSEAPHNAKKFLKLFNHHTAKAKLSYNFGHVIALEQKIQRQTNNVIKKLEYFCGGKKVELDKNYIRDGALFTELITIKQIISKILKSYRKTEVKVIEEDFLEVAAKKYKEIMFCRLRDLPCVIMTVHPCIPGGVFLREGKDYSDGMEETCYRRTTLFNNINDPHACSSDKKEWTYQIPEFGGVIAPNVLIIRESDKKGYKFIEKPARATFVLITPIKAPKMENFDYRKELFRNLGVNFNEHPRNMTIHQLKLKFEEKLEEKYRIAFKIAAIKEHRCIILAGPPMCCKCPPLHVAAIVKKLILEKFPLCFEEVIFCCNRYFGSKYDEVFRPLKIVFGNFVSSKLHFKEKYKKTYEIDNDDIPEFIKEFGGDEMSDSEEEEGEKIDERDRPFINARVLKYIDNKEEGVNTKKEEYVYDNKSDIKSTHSNHYVKYAKSNKSSSNNSNEFNESEISYSSKHEFGSDYSGGYSELDELDRVNAKIEEDIRLKRIELKEEMEIVKRIEEENEMIYKMILDCCTD